MSEPLEWMRRDWDARAQRDAREYIANGLSDDFRFDASGLLDAASILTDVHRYLRKDLTVLEIGCGIGRLLRYFALVFDRVIGVDVSVEMIAQSKAYLAACPKVVTHAVDGQSVPQVPDGSIGFAFSYVVFQHIPSKDVLRNYVKEMRRVLEPGGIFKFLVKYRSWSSGEKFGTWNGVDVTEADVEAWRSENGFEHIASYSVDEHVAWVVFRSPGS